jgi:hypothetical protein
LTPSTSPTIPSELSTTNYKIESSSTALTMTETTETSIFPFSIDILTPFFTPSTSSTISSELSTTNYKTELSSTTFTMTKTAEPFIIQSSFVKTTTFLT